MTSSLDFYKSHHYDIFKKILTCDSVTVSVDAVVYFNVIDAERALCSVDDFRWDWDAYFFQLLQKF